MPTAQPGPSAAVASAGEDSVQSWENLTSTAPSQLFGEAAEEGVEPGSPLRQTLRRDTSVLTSMMMSTGTLVSALTLLHSAVHRIDGSCIAQDSCLRIAGTCLQGCPL